MADFDLKRLSGLDWGVVGGALLAFIALFLPWYGVSSGPYSYTTSGWSTGYGWLGALLMIAAGAYLLIHRAVDLSKMSIGPGVAVLGLSALGTLIVIIRWLTLPRASFGNGTLTYGPQAGIYLALIVGIAQVVCAVLLFRASGESMPWADKPATAAPPPPPGPATTTPPPTASSMPPQPPPQSQPPPPQPGTQPG